MTQPKFETSFATTAADLQAVQALRYRVFVEELGGDGALVDHHRKLEMDHFDPFCQHLMLRDCRRAPQDQVVGVYRLMDRQGAQDAGGFYSAAEFDLSRIEAHGGAILELGRSCLHPAYRSGSAMHQLWAALADHVALHNISLLFGVASFHGTDLQALAAPLSLLQHRHLAPENRRALALQKNGFEPMQEVDIERRAAMRQIPSLIKAYLRLGGSVGAGIFLDHDFQTTDVFLVLDTTEMTDARLQNISRQAAR